MGVGAQDQTGPSFEVASVKRNISDVTGSELGIRGARFTATNVPLRDLILLAYGLTDLQLVDAPTWIAGERFDIDARASSELKPGTAPPQLRALLAERFKIQIHRETRDMPAYALVVARTDGQLGPGVHPTAIDYCAEAAARARAAPGANPPPGPSRCLFRMYGGQLVARAMGFGVFASRLAGEVHRFVIDKTGLSGLYDYDMTWSSDQGFAAADATGPSLFAALQEQLGLKLESQRAPIEVTVIDGVEHLIPN